MPCGFFDFGPSFSHTGGWLMGIGIILIAGIFVYLILFYNNSNQRSDNQASAMETLKLRYAKGELNKEQFEDAKKTIS